MTNRILESFSNTITVNLSSGGIVSIDVNDNVVNANNALYVGGLPATNVVSNAQLIANLVLYAPLASPTLTGKPISVTNTTYFDSSNQIATNKFVQNALLLSMSTVPMTITNGTYSFASASANLPIVHITTSSNSIITTTVSNGGSGLLIGDLIIPRGGNHDAILQVNTVSGDAALTLNIVYGGTGYNTSTGVSTDASSAVPYTYILSGVLTGNATILATPGSYLTGSQQWNFINNTTGPFSVIISAANSSDLPTGGRTVVIPQGTNANRLIGVETDSYNVDISSVVNMADLIGTNFNIGTINASSVGAYYTNNNITIGNSSINTVINSTSFSYNSPGISAIRPPCSVLLANSALTANANTVGIPVFPSGQQTVTLAATTTYLLDACFMIGNAASTNTALQILFANSAAIINFGSLCRCTFSNNNTTTGSGSQILYNNSLTAFNVMPATNLASLSVILQLRGTIVTGVSSTTITPQISYTVACNTTPQVLMGSWFDFTPITNSSVTTVGTWA